MQIVVIGATSPTGQQLVHQSMAAGHRVTAAVRRPDAVEPRAGLTVRRVDVTEPATLDAAVAGADAVVSVLGTALTRRPVSVYSTGMRAVLVAMTRHDVPRLLAVSSSVLDPRWRPSGAVVFNAVLDPYVNRVLGRTVHDDMRRMETLVRAGDRDWTLVRPSGLFDTPDVTDYAVAPGSADGVFTSRADLAAAMLAELTDRRYVRAAMGVATTAVAPSIVGLVRRELLGIR